MLTGKEYKLMKKTIQHMHHMSFTDPSGKMEEYVKKSSMLEIIEEFTQLEQSLGEVNFCSEFKKALSEHAEERDAKYAMRSPP